MAMDGIGVEVTNAPIDVKDRFPIRNDAYLR